MFEKHEHEAQLKASFTRKSRVVQNARRFVSVLGENYANKFND